MDTISKGNLFQGYIVDSKISEGLTSEVYRLRDQQNDRWIALKKYKPSIRLQTRK